MMDRWPDHRPVDPVGRPLIGAHRGASAHWPENSRAAFAGAIAAGADFIETDVRLTRDRVPVACHDAGLARLCGDACLLSNLSLAEARALHPALCTVADVCAQILPRALLLLDVKLTEADDLLDMAATLAPLHPAGRIMLGLRSLKAVRLLQPHLPGWPRLGLFADPADYPALAEQGGTWARLWEAEATPEQVARLQSLGLNVVIMTGQPTAQSVGVIDPDRLAGLLRRSPDAVMLNDPGMALRLPLRAVRKNLPPRNQES
jgi:glycerophosphoryl diester phosphodiesterase